MDPEDVEGAGGPYVLAVVRDPTRRERAEEELNRHAAEVADLYNNAPCGYHSLDEEGTFIAINDTELAWRGYTREEVVGHKRFTDFLTERSLRTFREDYPRFKERGWIRDLEFELVRKDGTLMWVLLSATAIKDAEGNFVASRSVFVDVTDRRRTEEALRRSNEELEARAAEDRISRSRAPTATPVNALVPPLIAETSLRMPGPSLSGDCTPVLINLDHSSGLPCLISQSLPFLTRVRGSPECVEGKFSELRAEGVLRSS